jgi:hypothetical protein
MNNNLVDTIPFTNILTESKQASDKLIVKGVVQRADAINQNGRRYPKHILERECKRYQEVEIKQKRALGELDHPESSVVNLRNVSHNITALEWKGNDLIATIEILSTPSGNILKELFKADITLGISSRGMGSVKRISESSDEVEIQEDFQLLCWDFVSDPSTHEAFMRPIKENKHTRNIYNKANDIIHEIICKLSGVCCINK